MTAAQFTNVTVNAQATITYDGRCSSHTIMFEDGRHKTLGVILPCDSSVEYSSSVPIHPSVSSSSAANVKSKSMAKQTTVITALVNRLWLRAIVALAYAPKKLSNMSVI